MNLYNACHFEEAIATEKSEIYREFKISEALPMVVPHMFEMT